MITSTFDDPLPGAAGPSDAGSDGGSTEAVSSRVTPLRVLLLAADRSPAETVADALRRAGFAAHYRVATTRAEYQALLDGSVDVVVAYGSGTGLEAPEALRLLRQQDAELPFILITDQFEHDGVECLKLGAADYFLKDALERLGPAVATAISQRELNHLLRFSRSELRASEQRFRLVAETVEDYAVVLLDPAGMVLSWSAGAQRHTGYTEAEILGRSYACFFTAEDRRDGTPERLLRQAAAEGRVTLDSWRVRRNGTRFWSSGVLRSLRDEAGVLRGFAKIYTDATSHRHAQEREQRTAAGLRTVLESADELIGCPDADSVLCRAVELARERLGLERCSIWLESADRERFHGTFGTSLSGETTDERLLQFSADSHWMRLFREEWSPDRRWLRCDGLDAEAGDPVAGPGIPWVVATPLHSRDGFLGFFFNDTAITGAALDTVQQELLAAFCSLVGTILSRHQIEDALRASEERLQRQNRALTTLAATGRLDAGRLEDAIRALTEAAATTLGVARASVWLYKQDRSGIECHDLFELGPDAHTRIPELPAASAPSYFQALEAEPTIVAPDVQRDPRTRELLHDYLQPLGIGAMLDAPIRRQGRVVGVVCHEHVGSPRAWTADEISFSRSIADLAAVALEAAERRRTAQALQRSEERYRRLLDTASEAVWSVDPEGRVNYVNHRLAELLAAPAESFLGRPVFEFIAEAERPEVMQRFSMRRMGVAERYDTRLRRADGSEVWVSVSSSPVFEEGRFAGALAMMTDVTERRLLEEQLRQSQKMEAIGRLAGGVAHDFNNMLAVINGYCELLLLRGAPEDPARPILQEMQKAGDRAATLTRQLLAFGRRQILAPQVLDVNELVRNIHSLLRRLIGEDVVLRVVTPDDPCRLKADPGQLEQVLMNLAVNARDAMPQGGNLVIETARVELDQEYASRHSGMKPGPYVLLRVSDTGCGMDRETQAQIFEPFFTTKERGKGTGLGLATVYGIVTQSGGHVWVYSELGLGTTFKIYFPCIDTPPSRQGHGEPGLLQGSETILVVEDEPAVRVLARQLLESAGYRVVTASRAEEALELCRADAEGIDLLLTDIVMPGIGGAELARRATELLPELKVLYMSGYTDDAVVRHGVEAARASLLEKPFTSVELARKVRALLDGATPGGRPVSS